MTQVIDFIGGEYRNRTGVHGFAILSVALKSLDFFVKRTVVRLWNISGIAVECKMAIREV